MELCQTCHAGCCRALAVPVTGADILRIERARGLDFWEFVCRWEDADGQIAKDQAPHFHFSDEPETPFTICLRQVPSVFLRRTDKCRFLVECLPDDEHPLGVARCGIYAERPAACRTFPTKLSQTAELAILCDVPERGREGDEPAYSLCPRRWETSDVDPLDAVHDLVTARYEMAFFGRLADMWNRSPRSWAVFPEFLRQVYAKRVIREPANDGAADEKAEVIRLPTPPSERLSKAA